MAGSTIAASDRQLDFGSAGTVVTRLRSRVQPRIAVALLGLLILSFALRFGLAVLFPNFFRPDEIFQTMEPAHRLLTGWGVVTWEWRDGIRSWMFPGFLAGVIQTARSLGLDHDATTLFVTAFLSLPGTALVAGAFGVGWRRAKWPGALICGLLIAIWPDLVYFGPKTLTEIQAGHLLGLAFCLTALMPHAAKARLWNCAGIGLLLGLTFCLRFQLAPALLPIAIAACGVKRERWAATVSAGLIPVVAMGLIDFWALGSPFQSIWKNFSIHPAKTHVVSAGVAFRC